LELGQQAGDGVGVIEVDAALEPEPSQRPVGGARVEEVEAELGGGRAADRRLAAAARAVDRDDDAAEGGLGGGGGAHAAIRQSRFVSSSMSFARASGTTRISTSPTSMPCECSMRKSSMLISASPMSVMRRASWPGRSAIMTVTLANSRRLPC